MLIDSSCISFNAEKHLYANTDTNTNLVSATQLIGLYTPKFDSDGKILARCAIKKGVSEEELKKQWEQAAVDGANRGTDGHKSIENYINSGIIDKKDPNKDIIKQFKALKFRGELYSETRIYNDIIAGTVDVIELFDNDTINIWDMKFSKKISSFCPFGNRMLSPIDYLFDTSLNRYSLQVSLYAYILEEFFGFWANKLTLLWINPKTRKIQPIEVPNRRKEVEKILKHYRQNYAHLPIDQLIRKE